MKTMQNVLIGLMIATIVVLHITTNVQRGKINRLEERIEILEKRNTQSIIVREYIELKNNTDTLHVNELQK